MHCVDFGESFQTHINLQNLASIQPRTSLVKFARGEGERSLQPHAEVPPALGRAGRGAPRPAGHAAEARRGLLLGPPARPAHLRPGRDLAKGLLRCSVFLILFTEVLSNSSRKFCSSRLQITVAPTLERALQSFLRRPCTVSTLVSPLVSTLSGLLVQSLGLRAAQRACGSGALGRARA